MTAVSDTSPAQNLIRLVNFSRRNGKERLALIRLPGYVELDPEIYLITRVTWRSEDFESPILPYLPRLLAIIESARGSNAVPTEVNLESLEGVMVHIPTGVRLSDIPEDRGRSISFLVRLMQDTAQFFYETVDEVVAYFWKAARQRGFSRRIVERMGRKEQGFTSPFQLKQFEELLHAYFSVKFMVQKSESKLRWER